jgi:hypothetical protein
MNDLLNNVVGWTKGIVEFGFSLALVFLVVDVLFGQVTGIVGNVAALVTTFVDAGVVGLIALLFFLGIYKD